MKKFIDHHCFQQTIFCCKRNARCHLCGVEIMVSVKTCSRKSLNRSMNFSLKFAEGSSSEDRRNSSSVISQLHEPLQTFKAAWQKALT